MAAILGMILMRCQCDLTVLEDGRALIVAAAGETWTADGTRPRVFTFWEPRGAVTPWLQLCRDTWRRGLDSAEVVTLDYANLDEYLPRGTLDVATLRRFPLMQQKDAVMVAILHRHGGIFIDMDTLMVDDIAPVMRTLDRTTLFNYGGNISVVGARAGATVLALWLERVQARIAMAAAGAVDPADVSWSFVGYDSLDEVYVQLRERSLHRRIIRATAAGRSVWAWAARLKPATGIRGSLPRRIPGRIEWELTRRSIARHMLRLETGGFYAELQGDRDRAADRQTQYLAFWFDTEAPVERVVRPGVRLVGLHNSWMPGWYAALSRADVLAHPSLISRTLRHLLAA